MQPTQGEGPWSSADYRNGSDIDSDNAYYDRMTQQALQRGGPGLSDSATNAEVMAYRMREAGFDGDMVPTGGAMPAGPGLTVKPRPLAFKPLPQLNEETGLMGFDQGNGVWSYPVPDRPAIETRPLGAAGSVSLPQVENLYTPLEGFFEGRYRMALEGLNDPNASLLDKTYYAVAGAGALPLAMLEAPVTGLYNAGNNAWRGGQNLARADMTSDPDVAVMSRLEATVNFAGAALGLGGPATLIEPRLSLGTPATRTGPIADDMLADNFTLGNSHPTVTLQVRIAADVNQAMVDAGNLAAWGGRTVTTEVVPAGTRFNMVVSEGQAQALMAGKPAFGAWATPDAVTSQAFARNNLAILPEFKPDVSMVVQVETTASQSLNRGLVGALRDYAGGANQVEFLGARNLRMVGQPQPLPPGH